MSVATIIILVLISPFVLSVIIGICIGATDKSPSWSTRIESEELASYIVDKMKREGVVAYNPQAQTQLFNQDRYRATAMQTSASVGSSAAPMSLDDFLGEDTGTKAPDASTFAHSEPTDKMLTALDALEAELQDFQQPVMEEEDKQESVGEEEADQLVVVTAPEQEEESQQTAQEPDVQLAIDLDEQPSEPDDAMWDDMAAAFHDEPVADVWTYTEDVLEDTATVQPDVVADLTVEQPVIVGEEPQPLAEQEKVEWTDKEVDGYMHWDRAGNQFITETPFAIPAPEYQAIARTYGEEVAKLISTTPAMMPNSMDEQIMIGRLSRSEEGYVLLYKTYAQPLYTSGAELEHWAGAAVVVRGHFAGPDQFIVKSMVEPANIDNLFEDMPVFVANAHAV